MKYLSNRDEFLKRSIIKIDEYRTTEDNSSINEEADSGPFANDIPWNDSLLGRLINSTIRKAKVGANLVRIKQVAKRLNGAFEDLLARSAEGKLTKEELAQKNKITIYKFLEALQKSVESGEKVYLIKNLTDLAIRDFKKFIEVTPADELAVDKTDLEKLVKQLEDFRKFLDDFNDDEGVDYEEEEEVKTEVDDSPGEDDEPSKEEEDAEKIRELFYTTTITLLKSVVSLCDVIKTKKIDISGSSTNQPEPAEQQKTTTVATKEPIKAEEVTAERFFYENESLPIFESKVDPKEVKSINAWKKVNNAYSKSGIGDMVVRIQDLIKNSESGPNVELYKKTINKIGYQVVSNEQTIGKNLLSLDTLVKEELNPTSENDIPKAISLFGNVILAFKGDMNIATKLVEANQPIKDFITSYDKLKELLPKLKAIKPEEKKVTTSEIKSENDIEIGKNYKYTNKKGETKDVLAVDKDKVVYPGPDKKYLTSDDKKGDDLSGKEFVSVATDKSSGSFAVDPTKLKKESRLFRYYDFINEAEEGQSVEDVQREETVTTDKGEEVSDPVKKNAAQEIKDYWEKNINIKGYVMTRTEVERTQIALEKASKNNIVIQGLDPIIEIVKVFNRAYKLHTTQVIPTGRSGGKVSNKTFREYTSFGNGSPDSAGAQGGPYRNNAIFDQWENAVQEIKKQTRFQKVFRQETTLKTEEGNIIKDAGRNLLKFMNDMLDGDALYKTTRDGKGKQAEFIEKYFGAADAEKLPLYLSEKDKEEVPNTANSMPKAKTLSFKKESLKFENFSELSQTFFSIQSKREKFFFYIQEVDSEYAYVTYCRSWYFFKSYISKSGISLTGSIPVTDAEKTENKQYIIKATRIKLAELIGNDGQIKLEGDYKVKYLTKYSEDKNKSIATPSLSGDDKDDNFIIGSEKSTLCEVGKDENGKDFTKRFKLSNRNIGEVIRTVGGFPTVRVDDINKTYFKK
jgi:hypothetical protein